MLQINIHCHICFGLRLLPKMLKIQTYLAGERLGREGWCGLLKSGPLTQLVKRFIASKERNHNEGKPHSRERKREQPPQRDPDNPKAGALLTSGPVLGGSIPQPCCGLWGWGTALALLAIREVSHSHLLRTSSRPSYSTLPPSNEKQINNSKTGMFSWSLPL